MCCQRKRFLNISSLSFIYFNFLKGINEWEGWTIGISDQNGSKESAGCDYVLDLISELEMAPAFPVVKNNFLLSNNSKVSLSG